MGFAGTAIYNFFNMSHVRKTFDVIYRLIIVVSFYPRTFEESFQDN